jgi:ABC-type transport system involved in multi-copper enzyme maturation permease subunit
MGATVIVEEREAGTLQYMLSNPISGSDYLLGRILGMLIATTGVVLIGFIIATAFAYGTNFAQYSNLEIAIVAAVMLNAIMLALSMIVSTVSSRRGAAVGLAIFIWFLFSVLSDIGVLAGLSANTSKTNPTVAIPGLILDPVYTATSWAILALGKQITQTQATGLVSVTNVFGPSTSLILMGIMSVWLAICLVIPFIVFRFRDVV